MFSWKNNLSKNLTFFVYTDIYYYECYFGFNVLWILNQRIFKFFIFLQRMQLN